MATQDNLSAGQFYHGSSHSFAPGDLVEPGHPANDRFSDPDHVYYSNSAKVAGGFARGGSVYTVEPQGPSTRDANYEARPGEKSRKSKSPLLVTGVHNP